MRCLQRTRMRRQALIIRIHMFSSKTYNVSIILEALGMSSYTERKIGTASNFSVMDLEAINTSSSMIENSTETNHLHIPVLTIFTTFKNQDARKGIHTNVLLNWAQFIPHIRPILFVSNTDPFLVDLAKKLGWMVLPVPHESEHGVPFLKEMFFASKNASSSVFYGYCNGDLLFDEGLVDTLAAVSEVLDTLGNTLVVGQRKNVLIGNMKLHEAYKVAKVASPLKLFRSDAEDYFFVAHNLFPWEKIKNVVIGRPAIDNYLVGMALSLNVSVVDASKTLTALHQTDKDGDFAGFKNKDFDYNRELIGSYNYAKGLTKNAQYETRYNSSHKVEVIRRSATLPSRKDSQAYSSSPSSSPGLTP